MCRNQRNYLNRNFNINIWYFINIYGPNWNSIFLKSC